MKRRISSMKKYVLDNLPAIWVVAVFVLGMALAANHASADEKKTITPQEFGTAIAETPGKLVNFIGAEVEKTKAYQKETWSKTMKTWPWNKIFKKKDQ